MTARDDAIEAAWKAIPDDPEVEHMDIAAAVVDAVEPIIRERVAQEIEAMDSGWTQYQRMPENTTHICYVHENGEVYDPERGWLPKGESLLLDHADPLVSRDRAARIARGGDGA